MQTEQSNHVERTIEPLLPAHPRVVVLGAGNVATHLAEAFWQKECDIVQVYSHTETSARCLAERIGCTFTTQPADVCTTAHLYLFSVKDDALPILLSALPSISPDALFVHTAGSVPLSVFEGKSSHFGVLYPLQTFSKERSTDLSVVPFFVEGNTPGAVSALTALAHLLSPTVVELSSDARRYLHLSAVWACNFANHCFAVGERLLAEHHLPFELLKPLITETVAKLDTLSPLHAQTGPAVRYDSHVIDKHVQLLEGHETWQRIYELMSKSIHEQHD